MLPVMSVIELLNGAFEIPWVVLPEPKISLTIFESAGAGKSNQSLNEHLNMPDMHWDRVNG